MNKSHDLTKKQMIEILVASVVLGVMLLIFDFVNTNLKFDGVITRNEAGTGSLTEELKLKYLDQSNELEVEVSDRRLSEKALKKVFNQAVSEIEATYLGENASADNVTEDLNLAASYVDGLIDAEWKVDDAELMSKDGKLKEENIPENGQVVNVTAFLYYEDEQYIYSFAVMVMPKSLDTVEGQLLAINRAIRNADEATRLNRTLKLPTKVEGMNLRWAKKMDYRGLYVIFLGVGAVVAISFGKKQDLKKAAKKLVEEKEQDYPMIVNQLSILMGAGMSFRKALERMVSKYVLSRKQGEPVRAGFEELLVLYRKMTDGKGELQALEELGKSCESKEYRKLAMLLTQNLQKGSKDLLNALEKEEQYAFEMRKQRAIRLGEEASTKLLIPMSGMLFIVIVVLIVPAIMQMNI